MFDISRIIKGTFIDTGDSATGAGGDVATPPDDSGSNITVGAGQAKFTGSETGTQTGDAAVAGQKEQKQAQSPETNKAFAQLRREKEALERKLQQYTQTVQQHFGQSMGLNDLDSYFNAVGQTVQQQQAHQQQQMDQYRSQRETDLEKLGYNVKEIREIMRTDPAFVQMNQENQVLKRQVAAEAQQRQTERIGQQIVADHAKLKEKYGDMVPELKDLDEDTVSLMKQGVPLRAAWLQANEDAILEHAKTTSKAKALRDVGSKNHLDTEKGGGGEFEAQIDIPDEQLRVWKSLFPGKKLADYKKMASKYKAAK